MNEQIELDLYDDDDVDDEAAKEHCRIVNRKPIGCGGIFTDALPYDDVADKSDLWELLKPIGTMGDYQYNGDS